MDICGCQLGSRYQAGRGPPRAGHRRSSSLVCDRLLRSLPRSTCWCALECPCSVQPANAHQQDEWREHPICLEFFVATCGSIEAEPQCGSCRRGRRRQGRTAVLPTAIYEPTEAAEASEP